jgi:hypothetical protein
MVEYNTEKGKVIQTSSTSEVRWTTAAAAGKESGRLSWRFLRVRYRAER